MKNLQIFCLLIFFILTHKTVNATTFVYPTVETTNIISQRITLAAGSHVAETKNLQQYFGLGTPDTVMYAFNVTSGQPIPGGAFYDDIDLSSGNRASRITFSLSATCEILIVVVAYSELSQGRADVSVDGIIFLPLNRHFGGKRITVNLSSTPTTPFDYHLVMKDSHSSKVSPLSLFLLDCSQKIVAFDDQQNGIGVGAKTSTQQNICSALIGSEYWGGKVSLVINDVATDKDGDGLGEGLEGALGTCDQKAGAGCYFPEAPAFSVIEPRDTDGDGISDFAEVLGTQIYNLNGVDPIYYPAWGANPRHKDMFIEVDYVDGYVNSNPHPFITDPNVYNQNPSGGQDKIEDRLSEIQTYFARVGSASSLKNPDGQDGITLHFDIGHDAPLGYETLFGKWGGSNIIPRSLDSDYNWDCDASVARTIHGQFNREGLFYYVNVVPLNLISCVLYFASDERGSGSLKMSYNVAPATWAHELGHYLGLAHWGQDEWGKVNCKPNYHSLMNYTTSKVNPVHFSLENFSGTGLQPYSLFEHSVPNFSCSVGQNPAYLGYYPFLYSLFSCSSSVSIDWNFSGNFDSSAIRAGLFWNNCYESSPTNAKSALFQGVQNVKIAENAKLTPPKILRWKNALYVFWVGQGSGNISYRHGELQKVSDGQGYYGSCQLPLPSQTDTDNINSQNCTSWEPALNLAAKNLVPPEVVANPQLTLSNVSVIWNKAAGWDDNMLTVAYQINSIIYVRTASPDANGNLSFDSHVHTFTDANLFSSPGRTGIELNWVRVNPALTTSGGTSSIFEGKSVALSLFYLNSNYFQIWATKVQPVSSAIWVNRGEVQFEDPIFPPNIGDPVTFQVGRKKSQFSVSSVNLPHLGSDGKTCILQTEDCGTSSCFAEMKLYCLDKESADLRWYFVRSFRKRFDSPWGYRVPNTLSKPNIIYHTRRLMDGRELPNQKGYFIITFSQDDNSLRGAKNHSIFARKSMNVEPSDLKRVTESSATIFDDLSIVYLLDGSFGYENIVLFEDQETAATKGVALKNNGDLIYIPLADGTYSITNGSGTGNDFSVMQKYLCFNLHRTEKWPCDACHSDSDCPSSMSCLLNGTVEDGVCR